MIKRKMRFYLVVLSILVAMFAIAGLSACGINADKQYIITFDANGGRFEGGNSTLTQLVNDGAYISLPDSPIRTNFTFMGWSKNKSDYEEWRFEQDKVKSSMTLYAQWEQESGILLSLDGGTIEGKDVFLPVKRNTNEVSLADKVECSAYSSWGLYRDANGEQEIASKKITDLNDGDNIFYIIVQNSTKANIYTVTIHRSYLAQITFFDGEEVLRTDSAYTGEQYNVSYNPKIKGYVFNYWENILGEQISSFTIWGEVNLYANKTACTYKVTLDVNNGDALSESEQTYDITYNQSYEFVVPTRVGYSFSGWYSGKTQLTNSEGKSIVVWSFADDCTITAQWTANQYEVTLKVNNIEAGSVSGDGSHDYDSDVTISATTNNGFNFLGWYDESDQLVSEEAKYTFKMGFEVSFTAKWDYFTLTTSRNNEKAGTLSTNYMDDKVSAGRKIALTAKTNKGYTWVGWYDGDMEISSESSFLYTMERRDVVLEARWAKVTLVKDLESGGTITSLTGTYKAGDEVTVTATTTGGFIFLGWYDGEERLTEELSYTITMPKIDKTFTARWIINAIYIDSRGEVQHCDEKNLTIFSTATSQTISGWCLLVGTVSGNITLTVSGETHLIIGDEANWRVKGSIRVSAGNTLNIYAQSIGEDVGLLSITGTIGGASGRTGSDSAWSSGGAGGVGGDSGAIIINGGIISATNIGGGAGGSGGAGARGSIGGAGGSGGANGMITINGGKITATNIGGGVGGRGGDSDNGDNKNGGKGGHGGNGGNGGAGGNGGTIIINGGSVDATNIGGGSGGFGGQGDSGNFSGGEGGIGGNGGNGGAGGKVEITGGSITFDNLGGGRGGTGGSGGLGYVLGSGTGGGGGKGGTGGMSGTITILGGTLSGQNLGGGIGGNGGSGGTGGSGSSGFGSSYGYGGTGGTGGTGGDCDIIIIKDSTINIINIGGGCGGAGGTGGSGGTGGYTNGGVGGVGGRGGEGGDGGKVILKQNTLSTSNIGGGIAGDGGTGGHSSGSKYANGGSGGSVGTKGVIYYESTQSDWDNEEGIDFINAEVYFYSKGEPNKSGNYWYYDEANSPVVWEAN